MSNEVKVKEIPFENVMILPPKPGVCRECAVDHKPDQPHNRDSLYYQMKFRQNTGASLPGSTPWHTARRIFRRYGLTPLQSAE